MSYFKKFTDICAGLAAFGASVFLIRKYMSFDPDIGEDAPSKLEQFLSPQAEVNYRPIIMLVILLLGCAIIGRIFKRFPYLCFALSLLPALHVAFMFEKKIFYQQIAFMMIAAALLIIGNIAECAFRDRDDGRHRLWICAKISSLAAALLSVYAIKTSRGTLPEDTAGIPLIKIDLMTLTDELDVKIISALFCMFAILLIISLLLYNVYFIDAVLAIIPAVYATHAMISDNLGVIPTLFFTAAIICAVTHLALAVLENNLSRKEQMALKKE